MKIVCDNCAAKYSIADEKVQGKVFKIRCKKCQHIIVVRGTGTARGVEPSGVKQLPYDDSPVWHVAIGREQVGPMTAGELRDRFARGEINAESYTWREGFSDWVRLGAVEEFADMMHATQVAPSQAEQPQQWPGAADGPTTSWSDQQQEDREQWTDGPGPTEQQAQYATSHQPKERDLFSTQDPVPGQERSGERAIGNAMPQSISAGLVPSSSRQLFPEDDPGIDEPHVMTGQRREESVLFSLANLQALAMGGGGARAGAPAASAPGNGASAGAPSAGGSGLIDIKALAATATSARSESNDLAIDLAPVAPAAPVFIPTAQARPGWVVPTIVGGVVMVVGVIGVLGYMVLTKEAPVVAVHQSETTAGGTLENSAGARPATNVGAGSTETAPKEAAKVPQGQEGSEKKVAGAPVVPTTKDTEGGKADVKKEPTGSSKPATAQVADPPAAKVTSKKSKGKAAKGKSRDKAKARVSKSSRVSLVELDTPAGSRKAARKKGGGSDSLDELLDSAIKKRPSKSTSPKLASQESSGGSNLPKQLEKFQIQAGMKRVVGRVQSCYDKYRVPGLAMVKVTIGRAGRIVNANVAGLFSGTPTGSCIKSAVRAARFPKFSGEPISIVYPFQLR
jgi:predicted Zn finger-like uncharacterized protein